MVFMVRLDRGIQHPSFLPPNITNLRAGSDAGFRTEILPRRTGRLLRHDPQRDLDLIVDQMRKPIEASHVQHEHLEAGENRLLSND